MSCNFNCLKLIIQQKWDFRQKYLEKGIRNTTIVVLRHHSMTIIFALVKNSNSLKIK